MSEYIFGSLDKLKLQRVSNSGREIFEVFAIQSGQQHAANPGALGSQDLLFDTAAANFLLRLPFIT